ncbi:hypothetical protein CKAH01_14367 [Colletotrichum kahawae]|uniref:Uncharacterized protein n=1 Tax=Colletotrichum kahawae TaxID=34407 RepID=A0AAE0D8N1_COLKA|nr:hypothetical protein CKAH01_14367 [Colletotrichum kahawae]
MTGRTLSNSSDVSVASARSRSDDHCDLLMSGLNTPAQEKAGFDSLTLPSAPEIRSPRGKSHRFVSFTFPPLISTIYFPFFGPNF